MVERFTPFADPNRPRLGRLADGKVNASRLIPPLPPVLLVDPNSCFVVESRINRRAFHKEDRR